MYSVKPDGTVTFVSPQIARYGYEPEEVVSRNFLEFVAPDCLEYVIRKFEESLASGESFPTAFKWLGKDGQVYWVELWGKTVYDDAGRPLFQVGVGRDIAERKRAEEALRESEANLARAEKIAHLGSWTRDFKSGTIAWSDEAYRIFGLEPKSQTMTYDKFLTFVHPEDRKHVTYAVAEGMRKGGCYGYQYRIIRQDGAVRALQTNGEVVLDEAGQPWKAYGTMQDITEHKRAEEALRESEEKYRIVADNTFDWEFWIDPGGRFVYTSPSCERVTGYTVREFVDDPSLLHEIVHPDDRQAFLEHEKERIYGGHGDMEFRVITKSGETRWIHHICQPVFGGNWRFIGSRGSNRDITERKRAEEALRDSEEMFRVLTGTASAAICIIQDGRLQYVNRAMELISEYATEELLSLNFIDLVHPDLREYIKGRYDNWLKGISTESRFEFKGVSKHGKERWIDVGVKTIDFKGRPALLLTGIDITERKRAEEALKESEEKFRVMAETMPAAICLYQGEQFIYVNPAAERIAGYTKEELLKMKLWDFLPPEFRDLLRERWELRRLGKPVPNSYEVRFFTKSGEAKWIDVAVGTISIGSAPTVFAIAFDITERKRAEEELKKSKAEAELYVDLMGHDINNMNQIALGYLELANDIIELEGSLGREHQSLVTKPIETLFNNSNLIRNVRKLQREKTGDYKPELIEVDKALGAVIGGFSQVAGRDMKINLKACSCAVMANELLKDVFQNLIGNAVKHSTGPLAIDVIVEQVEVDGHPCCKVVVEDNGPGIPDDVKKKLFDRLSLEKTKATGKGFGLCLIKMLVDDFGGQIWVEDRVPGDHTKGAKFVVMLQAIETINR